jgi:hypothetical protein
MSLVRRNSVRFVAVALWLACLLPGLNGVTLAASSNYLDVCTSGCTYTSVQAAINAITTSSATNVYTVFIDSGVLSTDLSTTTNSKSYINFVGRGEGVSILQASATWFTNVVNATTSADFFDLSHSTHITIRGLTIDARTNDPGIYSGTAFNGVRLENCDRILFDSAEVKALNYGIWEAAGTTGNLIEVYNSKFLSTLTTMQPRDSTWHIFSSEIKALQTGSESAGDSVIALNLIYGINTTVWGSHIHAESSKAGSSGAVMALRVQLSSTGSQLAVIGTQLHLKIGTTNIGSSTRPMYAFFLANPSSSSNHFDFIGSYLEYETPASISQGQVAGLAYGNGSANNSINFIGGGIFDAAGTGGTYRADVLQTWGGGTAPTIRFAGSKVGAAVSASGSLPTGLGSGYSTLNTQRGSVTLSSGTSSVTLPTPLPDSTYSVSVSTGVNETIRVTGKSTTGFTVTSSNSSSAAVVDWIVVR